MKRYLLRLISGAGELQLRGSELMTQVIQLVFPPTLPPGDRALIVGADGRMKYGTTAFQAKTVNLNFSSVNVLAGTVTFIPAFSSPPTVTASLSALVSSVTNRDISTVEIVSVSASEASFRLLRCSAVSRVFASGDTATLMAIAIGET